MKLLGNKLLSGFTLVESLLVLLVVTLVLGLPTLQIRQWRERLEYQGFIEEFEQRLIQTQQSAIVFQRRTRVQTEKEASTIEFGFFKGDGRFVIETLSIPRGVTIQRSVSLSFIGKSGNVEQHHTFRFQTPYHEQYLEYVYQIGSGRFVIKER
ncbi:competence type IV pilus minor pilin ComGD [uncultured Vagococcus sp.]|uniref:competence type IV pilus minor pilin ComGD n=1 Tax=uncultured Vagococcus sp. TaxID=189676 RepID=UPI0028D2FF8A|nr:competence type IV pilus minor pilin ComGD [uncultured Vagococcus sp.]